MEPSQDLASKTCIPCRGGVPPLTPPAAAELHRHLEAWELLADSTRLRRTLRTKNFATALDLLNRIGAVAEEQNHHPDLSLGWGRVVIDLWTHKIDGLTESDFILAAKIDGVVTASQLALPPK